MEMETAGRIFTGGGNDFYDAGRSGICGGSGCVRCPYWLCEHHPEHTEDCGYTEGTEGAACEHEHTEDCYTLVKKCVHEHDESCYPVLEGSVSENTATPI